jgi:hypothetical protein
MNIVSVITPKLLLAIALQESSPAYDSGLLLGKIAFVVIGLIVVIGIWLIIKNVRKK